MQKSLKKIFKNNIIMPNRNISVTKKPRQVRRIRPTKIQSNASPSTTPVLTESEVLASVEDPIVEDPIVESNAAESVAPVAPAKRRRAKPRSRDFTELHADVTAQLATAYEALKVATRSCKSMLSAHNREVTKTKHRETRNRTPSTLFDQELVDFFRNMLTPEELVVTRRGMDSVDVSRLDTETRLHRTDATQLYNKVIKKHGWANPKNGRQILYQNAPELVELLLSGNHPDTMEDNLKQLKDGSYVLTIFNIQKFTNPHLKRAPPVVVPEASAVAASS